MTIPGIQDAYPLSVVQQGLLYHAMPGVDQDDYLAHITLSLTGVINSEALQSAWESALLRHPALRASFVWEGVDEPLQLIHAKVPLPWQYIDCRGQAEDRSAHIARQVQLEHAQTVDLRKPPLMRFRLLQFTDTEATLLWTVHHLLADGWSTPIILGSVFDSYSSMGNDLIDVDGATTADTGYKRFIQWQRGKDTQSAKAYWRDYLRGAQITPLRLAPLHHRESAAGLYRQRCSLDVAKTALLSKVCRDARVTLATLVVGAWAQTMRSFCHHDQPLIGITMAGRAPEIRDIESAVGLYISTLPLRVDCASEKPLAAWLSSIQSDMQRHAENDHLPLSAIQSSLGVEPGQVAFESVVAVEGHSGELVFDSADGTLRAHDLDYQIQSHFALSLLVTVGESLDIVLVRDPERISEPMGTLLAGQFMRQLDRLADAFDSPAPVARLDCHLDSNEPPLRAAALPVRENEAAWHSLVDRFEAICDQRPDEEAIVFGGQSLSYAQLDELSNRIANALLSIVQPGELVALCLPRSIEQIAALWAVLKTGCAYVPIDPAYPVARVQTMLEVSAAKLLLLDSNLPDGLNASCPLQTLSSLISEDSTRPSVPSEPGSLAYVMFTSGSTGVPKGVEITHGNIAYSTQERHRYYRQSAPRFLLQSTFSFDSSVAGIYGTLLGGGTLILPAAGEEKDVSQLLALIQTQRVSQTLCLPSVHQLLLEFASVSELASLETVIVAGEVLDASLVNEHLAALPNCGLHNEYGPTEACVWCAVEACESRSCGPVPIGRSLSATPVIVVNHRLEPCAPGVLGEILIGGPGLAQGYRNNELASSSAFVTLNEGGDTASRWYRTGDIGYLTQEGKLMFSGRQDRQTKLRGQRIELGDVEAALRSHPRVNEAVAMIEQNPSGSSKRLVLYCTVAPETATNAHGNIANELELSAKLPDVQQLMDWIQQRLPMVMWPAQCVILDDMPRLPNGKLDIHAMSFDSSVQGLGLASETTSSLNGTNDDESAQLSLTPAGTDIDISEIQQLTLSTAIEILGSNSIALTDHFFSVGGDSISGMRFCARLQSVTGVAMSFRVLLDCRDLADVARILDLKSVANSPTAIAGTSMEAGEI